MSGVTICQLGVLLFILCLSVQIVAQTNSTAMPPSNTTDVNGTSAAPVTHSNPNVTTPKSAMSPFDPAGMSLLLGVAMVTSLLHRVL